jgi:hypothetical protein
MYYLEPESMGIQYFATTNEILIVSFVNESSEMGSHDDVGRNSSRRFLNVRIHRRVRLSFRQHMACKRK